MTRRSLILFLLAAVMAAPAFAAHLVPVSRQIEIAPPKASESSTLKYFYYQPTAASLGPAGYAVSWATDFVTSDPQDRDVYSPSIGGVRLNLQGRTAGEFEVSTGIDPGQTLQWPALARVDANRFVSVYCQTRDQGSDVWFRRFESNTLQVDPEPVRLGTSPVNQFDCDTAVASNSGGRFAIAWMRNDTQGWSPFVQIFDASGEHLTTMLQVSHPAGSMLGPPAVGMDHNGRVVVVWHGDFDSTPGIWMQRFSRAGLPLRNPVLLAEGVKNDSRVAIAMGPDGGFLATWAGTLQFGSRQSLLLRRFRSDGQPVGPAVEVSQMGAVVYDPALARDAFGNVAVFWIAGQGTPALAVFTSNLVRLGPVAFDGPAAPYPPSGQTTRGAVAFGADGRILTVWLRPSHPKARDSVMGQIWQIQ
jgi:hypothetical protein